jgi:hypothetical protein
VLGNILNPTTYTASKFSQQQNWSSHIKVCDVMEQDLSTLVTDPNVGPLVFICLESEIQNLFAPCLANKETENLPTSKTMSSLVVNQIASPRQAL